MERRQFIQGTAGTALASVAALARGRILGANDRLNVALIGWADEGERSPTLWLPG